MAYDILKGSSGTPLVFLMVESADHITGLTGATCTVTISKNGGAFGSPSGSVTEIANGWYQVAGNATDTGTAGPLVLHATAASGDPTDIVVANIIDPTVAVYGSNLVNIKGTASAGAAGYVGVDWNAINAPTTTVDLSGTTIKNLDGNTVQTGDVFAQLPTHFSSMAIDASGNVSLSAAELNSIADALLNRDMAAGTDTNTHSPRNALRFLRNTWSISGTTLTVTKEDQVTSAWTATVGTTPGVNPITSNTAT